MDNPTVSGGWAEVNQMQRIPVDSLMRKVQSSPRQRFQGKYPHSSGNSHNYFGVNVNDDSLRPKDFWADDESKSSLAYESSFKENLIGSNLNGSLMVLGAVRENEGRYLCQATNGVGPPLSKIVTLTVHGELLSGYFLEYIHRIHDEKN